MRKLAWAAALVCAIVAAAWTADAVPLMQVEDTLASGETFLVSFTQDAPRQREHAIRSVMPVGQSAAVVVAAMLAVLGASLLRRAR